MSVADVLCFSHLRWNFVFQRPNHLMTRCARDRRVLYIEEAVDDPKRWLERIPLKRNLWRLVPHLPAALSETEQHEAIREMLRECCAELEIERPIHWFYTPMMLPIAAGMPRSLVVYDCMDELSSFKFAPPQLKQRETQLMEEADVMFTGGMALFEAKRALHGNVHGLPSSVDVDFFGQARTLQAPPDDQAMIPSPRIGYCGVIDERLDLDLLRALAVERPAWQIVLVGPVVKIDPESLPSLPNVHYLGAKPYAELPRYLAGWDVAIMPFALNEATRFISPTKTPEYLAAGCPVTSTAIRDVVEPYESRGFVRIGRSHSEFIAHVEAQLQGADSKNHFARDAFLAANSWDATWERMRSLIHAATAGGSAPITWSARYAAQRSEHV